MIPDKLKATDLRLILIGALILIIGAHIGLTVYGRHLLLANSKDVTDAVTQARISQTTLNSLQESKRQLDEQRETFERSKELLANAASYNYQREVIEDITAYARKAGVNVTGFTFQSQGSSSNGASEQAMAPAAEAAPAAPSSEGTPATQQPAAGDSNAPGGAAPKSVSVTLALESPIEYRKFLAFISLLQNNLTQYKVDIPSLSGTGGGGGGAPASSETEPRSSSSSNELTLNMPTLTMEIYTK